MAILPARARAAISDFQKNLAYFDFFHTFICLDPMAS